MKKILKYSVLMLAVTLTACKNDSPIKPENSGEPEEKQDDTLLSYFDDYSVLDGVIVSPQWLVDEVEKGTVTSASGMKFYPDIFLLRYQGEVYVCIDNALGTSSYIYAARRFFNLSGEWVAWDGYPPSKAMTDMWFELAKALSETGVFLWPEQKYDSPRTRVDEKVPGFVKTPHGTPFEEVYIADEIPDYIKRSNVN